MPCLRRLSIKYPPRLRVLNAAKTTYYVTSKKGTQVKRVSFKCSQCGVAGLKQKDVQVDHKIPIGSFTTMDEFVDRLFCEESNLQLLCFSCHSTKTEVENHERLMFDKKTKE